MTLLIDGKQPFLHHLIQYLIHPRSNMARMSAPPSPAKQQQQPAAIKTFQPLTLAPIQFSLTEGTNIPAPAPEPEVASSTLHSNGDAAAATQNGSSTLGDSNAPLGASGAAGAAAVNHEHVAEPQSPTSPRSGIRKFLSLRSLRRGSLTSPSRSDLHSSAGPPRLNTKASSDSMFSSRPGSPFSIASSPAQSPTDANGRPLSPRLGRKRSSGWFGSAGRRRSSYAVGADEEVSEDGTIKRVRGPPPPTIPEFASLGAMLDGGALGGEDLFQDIKYKPEVSREEEEKTGLRGKSFTRGGPVAPYHETIDEEPTQITEGPKAVEV